MKKSAMALILTAGIGLGAVSQAEESVGDQTFAQSPFVQVLPEDGNGKGVKNWEEGYFEVTGFGSASERENVVQWENLSLEAARVMAFARLAELVEGVTVRARTAVEDGLLSEQIVTTKVEGTVRGAVRVDQKVVWISGGNGKKFPRGEVTMRLCLHNKSPACLRYGSPIGVYQNLRELVMIPPAQIFEAPKDAGAGPAAKASGLIIDLGPFVFEPVLDPEIATKDGRVVYGAHSVSPAALLKNGPAQFAASADAARKLELLGAEPMTITVQDVQGNRIIVSDADAAKIAAADILGSFLAAGRVAIAAGT